MSPFDFLNAINMTKVNLFAEEGVREKDYSAFMVNRGLSYFPDTVMLANEMNRWSDLDGDVQFSFLLNSVTKRKRFSKWHKKDADTEELKLVMDYYKMSSEKAHSALDLLTKDQLELIRTKMNIGGR